jgi:hypothetical protein
MKDITQLQNVVLDKGKLATLVKTTEKDYLKQLLQIGDSQISNLRRGEKGPSADNLLRLMMLYGVKAEDIVTVSEATIA